MPGLKITIPESALGTGDPEEISVVYTHTVSLIPRSGPRVTDGRAAAYFDSEARLFGFQAEGPSPLHKITCEVVTQDDQAEVGGGVICAVSPLVPESGSYRIALATDHEGPPTVALDAPGARLIRAEDAPESGQIAAQWWLALVVAGTGFMFVLVDFVRRSFMDLDIGRLDTLAERISNKQDSRTAQTNDLLKELTTILNQRQRE